MRKSLLSLFAALLFSPIFANAQIPIVAANPAKTYRAAFSVTCAGAGDCVTLYGFANVREIYISKPSAAISVTLIKRSAVDTGGTASALTAVPMNSKNSASAVTVDSYTAVPTAGTAVGDLTPAISLATTDTLIQDFGLTGGQSLALNSSSEGLAISVSGAVTLTGYVEWTEP